MWKPEPCPEDLTSAREEKRTRRYEYTSLTCCNSFPIRCHITSRLYGRQDVLWFLIDPVPQNQTNLKMPDADSAKHSNKTNISNNNNIQFISITKCFISERAPSAIGHKAICSLKYCNCCPHTLTDRDIYAYPSVSVNYIYIIILLLMRHLNF